MCQSILLVYYIFNFFWSICFFSFGWYLFSFIWLLLLWVLIFNTIASFYEINKTAADLENAVSITAAQQSDSFYILFRYDISWDIESSPLCLLFILTEDTDLTSLVSMIATLCACVCVRWEVEEDIK